MVRTLAPLTAQATLKLLGRRVVRITHPQDLLRVVVLGCVVGLGAVRDAAAADFLFKDADIQFGYPSSWVVTRAASKTTLRSSDGKIQLVVTIERGIGDCGPHFQNHRAIVEQRRQQERETFGWNRGTTQTRADQGASPVYVTEALLFTVFGVLNTVRLASQRSPIGV